MMRFHPLCGKNILFTCGRQTAERKRGSYDHGIVYSGRPLQIKSGEIFQLKIEGINNQWAGSLVSYCN